MNTHLSFFADENISTDLINWVRNNGWHFRYKYYSEVLPIDRVTSMAIFTFQHWKVFLKHKELIQRGTIIIGHRLMDKIKIRIKQIET